MKISLEQYAKYNCNAAAAPTKFLSNTNTNTNTKEHLDELKTDAKKKKIVKHRQHETQEKTNKQRKKSSNTDNMRHKRKQTNKETVLYNLTTHKRLL